MSKTFVKSEFIIKVRFHFRQLNKAYAEHVCANFSKVVVYFLSVLLAMKYHSLFFPFTTPGYIRSLFYRRLPVYLVRISSWIFEWDFRVGFRVGFLVGFPSWISSWISSWIFDLDFRVRIFLAGFPINFQWFYTTYFVSGIENRLEVFSRWRRTRKADR